MRHETADGIVAILHKKKGVYVFKTKVQSKVENAMMVLGFGCTDYVLDFWKSGKIPRWNREKNAV